MLASTKYGTMSIAEAVGKALEAGLKAASGDQTGRKVSTTIAGLIKNHFTTTWPGSEHYSPSKVTASAPWEVGIDVPGIARAWRDVDIRPKNAAFLAIPVHPEAHGKKPSEIPGLFRPKGKSILAVSRGGQLVAMFALSQGVV